MCSSLSTIRPVRGAMEEQRYDDVGLVFEARDSGLQASENETADGAAEEAGETRRVVGGEGPGVNPLLNERRQRALDGRDVPDRLAVESGRRGGARRPKEAVLERDEEERPVTIDVREHAREPYAQPLVERSGLTLSGCKLSAKGLAALFEQSAQDVFLGSEMIVNRADRDSGALGNVLNSRRVKAPIGDDLFGRVQYGVAKERARFVPPAWDGDSFNRTGVHRMCS
jgi:hypothetical protein